MTFKSILPVLALSAVILATGCKKKNPEPEPTPEPTPAPTPSYTIPSTYTFSNMDYSSSTMRLSMLSELTFHIRASHTMTSAIQPTVNAQTLKNMFMNAASSFTQASLNTSGLQLKDKCSTAANFITELEASFDDAQPASITAAANPTVTTASSGTKGKLIGATRAILVDANGLEYKEVAEKGIMGALLYYQATTLLNNIGTFDNITAGANGTAQEHAWDEAFGYFGVPVDFPANTTGLKNWGSYCNSVNAAIGSNTLIMNAFLKGRAAITAKNYTDRDAAKATVIATWEKVVAAKCINYLKGAKANIADDANRHHNLSEALGFIKAFRYNPVSKINETEIQNLLANFGTNLYGMTIANIDNVINGLAAKFELNPAVL